MKPILLRILTTLAISIVIYFGLAFLFIYIGVPKEENEEPQEAAMSFEELFISYDGLPELLTYPIRDGTELHYRYYPAETAEKVLILLHGSGWHSRYFFPLASYLSSQDVAHIYTPDLRGHGEKPLRRGDIDYIEQFEDDIADLLELIRISHPEATLIMAGHSSGGGLALRFGGSQYGQEVDAYLLMAPFLKYNAPTAQKDYGGWATPYNLRIAGLTMLNNFGIRALNHLEVIRFNMPEEARDGTETLAYTHRLNTGYAPRNYKEDLAAISQPLLVLVGSADETFIPDQYPPTVQRYNPDAKVILLPGLSHMGVVVNQEAQSTIERWIKTLE